MDKKSIRRKNIENKIIKQNFVEWEKLKLFQPANLKKMSKSQLDKLKTSFKKNGFKSPFYVWEDKEDIWCLDGHMRLPILKLLRDEGETIPDKLPANFVDCKNKKEAKKAVLIYNSHYADIIQDSLNDWIKDLNFDDLIKEIDITNIDISFPVPETKNDDEIPENVKFITKMGDLWELGRHRVLCGDSTKIEDVERLINKNKANMIFTDPPYDILIKFGILNKIIENGNIFIFQNDREIKKYLNESKFNFKKFFVFYHNTVAIPQEGGREPFLRHILITHETKGEATKLQTKEGLSSVIKSEYRHKKEMHKHLKSIKSIEPVIKGYSKETDLIFDLFLGSGSTIIACEKNNRICYGLEIEPNYCDVIVERYKKWCLDNNRTPKIKLNGVMA